MRTQRVEAASDGSGCAPCPTALTKANNACRCDHADRNREVQRGIRFPLEMFKTEHKGWGLRSRWVGLLGGARSGAGPTRVPVAGLQFPRELWLPSTPALF